MALLLIFATGPRLVPDVRDARGRARSTTDIFDRLADFLAHLALPLTTVALGLIGQYAIVMRSSIIETLSEDYVTTARAMGLKDGRILRHHALPNALLPTVTLIAINLGYIVAGRDHGRGRLQLAGPRDARGRGAGRPATTRSSRASSCSSACRSSSPTSWPTSIYGVLDPRVRT